MTSLSVSWRAHQIDEYSAGFVEGPPKTRKALPASWRDHIINEASASFVEDPHQTANALLTIPGTATHDPGLFHIAYDTWLHTLPCMKTDFRAIRSSNSSQMHSIETRLVYTNPAGQKGPHTNTQRERWGKIQTPSGQAWATSMRTQKFSHNTDFGGPYTTSKRASVHICVCTHTHVQDRMGFETGILRWR